MIHRRSAVVALALLLVGCEGPDRTAGRTGGGRAPGPPGRRAHGSHGPARAPPAPSADGGVAIPVGCLSPCHGFNGVVAQFQTSVHYTEYLVNVASATPETEWTTPGAAVRQLPRDRRRSQQRVTGNVGTTDDGGVVNLASGELQYARSGDGRADEPRTTPAAPRSPRCTARPATP